MSPNHKPIQYFKFAVLFLRRFPLTALFSMIKARSSMRLQHVTSGAESTSRPTTSNKIKFRPIKFIANVLKMNLDIYGNYFPDADIVDKFAIYPVTDQFS